ncbi:cysteine hydrolase family protein [Georgenia subflava]|uniref:Isochorismatase family protein n=1 Tax=Georgenia subflava TaxID=1622177 RepID=A0A6N7EFJ2_9MICO|nr:cysteine hydrolase [Georgenia subflava]MPV36800.1 isochorismatase family protein [Georgenia subflava]
MTDDPSTEPAAPWLVVIDPQRIFAEPPSPWAAPGFDRIVEPVRRLAETHAGRVVVTRFVAPDLPAGSWREYYRDWPFALVPDDDPLYEVVPALADLGTRTVTEPTFGKWGPGLLDVVGPAPHLVLTGVATDCCVLSTALAAADGGAHVQVVADACAGSDEANHRRALDAMSLYAPQITVTTSAELLA